MSVYKAVRRKIQKLKNMGKKEKWQYRPCKRCGGNHYIYNRSGSAKIAIRKQPKNAGVTFNPYLWRYGKKDRMFV